MKYIILLKPGGCNVAASARLAVRGLLPSPTSASTRRRLSLSSLPSCGQELPLHSLQQTPVTSSSLLLCCSPSLLSSSSRLTSLHRPLHREMRISVRHLSSSLPPTSPPPQGAQSLSSASRSSPSPFLSHARRSVSLRLSLSGTSRSLCMYRCDRMKMALSSSSGIREGLRRRRRSLANSCHTQAWGGDEERRSRRRKRKGENGSSSSFSTALRRSHVRATFPSLSLFSSSFSILPSYLQRKNAVQDRPPQKDRKRFFSSSYPLLLRQNLLPFPLLSYLSYDRKTGMNEEFDGSRRRYISTTPRNGLEIRDRKMRNLSFSSFFSPRYTSSQLHRGEEGKCVDTALRFSSSSSFASSSSLLETARRKASFASAIPYAGGEDGVSAATHEKEKREEQESPDGGVGEGNRNLQARNGVKEEGEEEQRKVFVDRSEGELEEEKLKEEEEDDDFQPCVQDEDSLALMQQMCESFNERRHRRAHRKSQRHTLHIVQEDADGLIPSIMSPSSSCLSSSSTPTSHSSLSSSSSDAAAASSQARDASLSFSSSSSSPRFDYLSPSSSSASCSSSTFSFTFDPLPSSSSSSGSSPKKDRNLSPSSSTSDPRSDASYSQSSSPSSSAEKERWMMREEESKGTDREEGKKSRVLACNDLHDGDKRGGKIERQKEKEEEKQSNRMMRKNGYATNHANTWAESSSSSSSSSCASKCRNVQENDREEFLVVDLEKLRKESLLTFLPVQTVLRALVDKHPGMYVWREGFVHTVQQLLNDAGIVANTPPTETSLNQAFDVLDKSDNEIIDLLEAVRGLPQLCRASHLDRIQALFALFDRRSSSKLHFDEMMEVFCFIYRVMLTPSVVCQFKQACLHFSTIDDLALHTTQHLFSGRYQTHREKNAVRDPQEENERHDFFSLSRETSRKNAGRKRSSPQSRHSNNSISTTPTTTTTTNHSSSSSSYAPQLFSCFGGGRLSRSINFRYSQRNSCSSSSSSSSSQRKKVYCLDGENEGREDEEQDSGEETSSFYHSSGHLTRQQEVNDKKNKSEREIDHGRRAQEEEEEGRGGGGVVSGATGYRMMGYDSRDGENRTTMAIQRDNLRSDLERSPNDIHSNGYKKNLKSDSKVQDDCLQEEEYFFSPSSSSGFKKNGCQRSCSPIGGYGPNRSEEKSEEEEGEEEEGLFSSKNGLPPWSIVMRRTEATPIRRRKGKGRGTSDKSSLSPRCSSSSSSSSSQCSSNYRSVEEGDRKNKEDHTHFFFETKRNGEKGERSRIGRGSDGEEEEITEEEEEEEEDDPWKQAIRRRDEYMTFDDFKAM
ncbi:hypothetical protein CSUI_008052 [Cystoisospora suis]|uniref:EF-hand domain-containing protein n=1 Tax=Cystoisospora suis TaxID=483139 RepID=A0A2C6KP20_9APIC|nr:hypothetical protein CSUI_008052 [Cystoisospora suis]